MLKSHGQLMLMFLRISDLLAALAAWGIGLYLRDLGYYWGLSDTPGPQYQSLLTPLVFSLLLTPVLYSRAGLYEPKRAKSPWLETADIGRTVLILWAATYLLSNFTRTQPLSRLLMTIVLAAWLVVAVVGRTLARAVLRRMRRKGWNLRQAAIVGGGRLGQRLCHALRRESWTGIVPRYFIDEPTERSEILGLPKHGPISETDRILASHPVDIVFVALPNLHQQEAERVLGLLANTTVDVRVVPDLLSFHFLNHDVSSLGEIPIITLTWSPQHGWNSLLKRVFDLVVSTVAILLVAFPMLIIAAAVKLSSPGPVFYRQKRMSLSGTAFWIIKYRTMRVGAEKDTGPVWASRDDPRVTRLGGFLRRSSLDELPQLFNVFLGQMSLVGPRPERPELIERFRKQIPRYMQRQQVKAGLTGWAQVHGLRGQTSLRKRVQYDLYYISNWSFGLDLRIILMTPFRGLRNPNAY
jgi:Undecaprenyl-phosphate glucose phosphotransferase